MCLSEPNVTFVVKAWPSIKQSELIRFWLHIFVVDPEGTVKAEFPQGDSPSVSTYGFSGILVYQFSTNGQNNLGLATDFTQQGIMYTMTIPNDHLSEGTWRIHAFATGVTPANSNTNISGAGTGSFDAFNSSVSSSLFQTATGVFGFAGLIYNGGKFAIGRGRLYGSARKFLINNWWSILSVVLVGLYIYSIYYPF